MTHLNDLCCADDQGRHDNLMQNSQTHIASVRGFVGASLCDDVILLTHGKAKCPADAIDMLYPLLTRRMNVQWQRLTSRLPSTHRLVHVLDHCVKAMHMSQPWTNDAMDRLLAQVHADTAVPQDVLQHIMIDCIFFSEDRLPLKAALTLLGREACLSRLNFAASYLRSASMVG
jgi:hypothetical protein